LRIAERIQNERLREIIKDPKGSSVIASPGRTAGINLDRSTLADWWVGRAAFMLRSVHELMSS
jgi:hypothetical protein